jgi:hypothetical protein
MSMQEHTEQRVRSAAQLKQHIIVLSSNPDLLDCNAMQWLLIRSVTLL